MVCGAGASSTFVALRLRKAAAEAGLRVTALAAAEASFAIDLDSADVVLVGPHLERSLEDILALAAPRGVRVALLPDDIFSDLDGSRALALARAAADPGPAPQGPRHDSAPAENS